MFFRTPFFLPLLYPGLIWKIPTGKKEIYLTFDDGPIPGPTEFVLGALKKANAKATFFCIGDNVGKYPAIFKKILSDGHAIGNHTFNHLKGWNYSVADYVNNVRQCTEEFLKHRPAEQKELFRPPYGRIKRAQIRALQNTADHNYEMVMWDVLSYDYDQTLDSEKCLNGTINAIRSGSVVVFHDSLKAEKNMTYALPRLLDHFSAKGYSFKSIPNNLSL